MNKIFEWQERGNGSYYYNTSTGKIVGVVSKLALSDIWIALVYTGEYTFTLDDERHLGQYISMDFAKNATEYFWNVNERTLLEHT